MLTACGSLAAIAEEMLLALKWTNVNPAAVSLVLDLL